MSTRAGTAFLIAYARIEFRDSLPPEARITSQDGGVSSVVCNDPQDATLTLVAPFDAEACEIDLATEGNVDFRTSYASVALDGPAATVRVRCSRGCPAFRLAVRSIAGVVAT